MEPKKQGGKRRGAGRKPILSKKKQISLYVEGLKIVKFGNEEKLKKSLYDFINDFGADIELNPGVRFATSTPDAYDGKRLDKITNDEPGQWQEPKSNITGLPPKLSDFDKFMAELKDAKTIHQVEGIMKRAKTGIMFPRQLMELDAKAKELSKEMYSD